MSHNIQFKCLGGGYMVELTKPPTRYTRQNQTALSVWIDNENVYKTLMPVSGDSTSGFY